MPNFFEGIMQPQNPKQQMMGSLFGPVAMMGLGALLNKKNRGMGAMQGLMASNLISPFMKPSPVMYFGQNHRGPYGYGDADDRFWHPWRYPNVKKAQPLSQAQPEVQQ